MYEDRRFARYWIPVFALLLFAVSGRADLPSAGPESADLVLRGGAVYTVDAVRSWAEAVALRGGRIVYVGTDRGVADYVGPNTRVVELRGKMVLPGTTGGLS